MIRASVALSLTLLWRLAQPAPVPAAPPAEIQYQSIEVLKAVPSFRVPVIMKEWSKALGVECGHCHEGEAYERTGKDTHAVARRMARMVTAVSEKYLKAEGGVSCWSCHRGSARPARFPGDVLDLELAKWPRDLETSREEHALSMSVFNVSLDVSCQHCHLKSRWKSRARAQHQVAKRMVSMFDEFPTHLGKRSGRMQCFTCHHGSVKVEK